MKPGFLLKLTICLLHICKQNNNLKELRVIIDSQGSMRFIFHLCILSLFVLSFTSNGKDWVYVVSEGDNLWNISKKHLNKVSYYEDVRRINNITLPKRIPPGTLIRIPLDWVKRHAASVSVKHITGQHQLVRNGQTLPVKQHDKIELGDELRLDNKGSITLKFADGSEMTLSDNVIISFDHLTQYGQTGMVDSRVRINQGKMEIRAEKQHGAGSRLDIASASAVTSVRGTVFRVGIDKKDPETSLVEVVEGEVAVSQGGDSVAIPEGYGLKVVTGATVGAPVKLLAATQVSNLPNVITKSQYEVHWTSIEKSKSYNVSLANDPKFSSIVWQNNTKENKLILPELNDGNYHLRVTALDKESIEGKPADYTFTINQFPLAPTINPINVIFKNTPKPLTWGTASPDTDVLLQISSTNSFDSLAYSKQIKGNSFSLDSSLPVGKYFWRLATAECANSMSYGPFSTISEFLLTVNLAPPLLQGTIKDAQVIVTAINKLKEQEIEIELAPTIEFETVSNYTLIGQQNFSVPKSNTKVQYLRARVRDTKFNLFSDWSRHCKVSEQQYVVCGI
jgi:hypothetical protein